MKTADDLVAEWIATRERLVDHIRSLQPAPTLHIAGDPVAEARKRSLALLLRWQTDLDVLVTGLLVDSVIAEES